MTRLFRNLCVSLCAALVAVLSLHGVQEGRHQIAHASVWSAVAIDHDNHADVVHNDHDSPSIHVAHDVPVYDKLDQAENIDGEGDTGLPTSHHHHSSGDNHTAIPVLDRDVSLLVAMNAALLQPALDNTRPAHGGDGPEYPPKRMRAIL